jgi:hypothetical protein
VSAPSVEAAAAENEAPENDGALSVRAEDIMRALADEEASGGFELPSLRATLVQGTPEPVQEKPGLVATPPIAVDAASVSEPVVPEASASTPPVVAVSPLRRALTTLKGFPPPPRAVANASPIAAPATASVDTVPQQPPRGALRLPPLAVAALGGVFLLGVSLAFVFMGDSPPEPTAAKPPAARSNGSVKAAEAEPAAAPAPLARAEAAPTEQARGPVDPSASDTAEEPEAPAGKAPTPNGASNPAAAPQAQSAALTRAPRSSPPPQRAAPRPAPSKKIRAARTFIPSGI